MDNDAIVLHGPTPGGVNQGALGTYARAPGLTINERPVYACADGTRSIWHAGGSWFVGSTGRKGALTGFLSATDDAHTPDAIEPGTWRVSSRSGWRDAPGILCVLAAEHAAAHAAALKATARTLYIYGRIPGGVNVSSLGRYKRKKGALLNERPVYVNDDDDESRMVWWAQESWVSRARSLTPHDAFAMCCAALSHV